MGCQINKARAGLPFSLLLLLLLLLLLVSTASQV